MRLRALKGGRWGLALAVLTTLAACAAPPGPQPTTGAPAAPRPVARVVEDPCRNSVSPSWSVRRKVVRLAVCEWAAFDRPRLLLEPGSWAEAQVAFGSDESGLEVWDRVAEYWDAADPEHATEARAVAAAAPSRELWPAWRRPWSAAFISWILTRAGALGFTPDPAHAGYLEAAVARDPSRVVDIAAYTPVTGDLVCAGRGSGPRDATEFLGRLTGRSGYFPSHCDVIVEVGPNEAVLIGGNVKNSVTATVTPLRDGRLTATATRPWAVALRLEAEPDPCATLSPGEGC